jgi:Ser/Thr protein kinase RdoA (MazF antagonist)
MTGHPYEALTPDAVMAAIESIGYHCDARILALNSYENRVYQVGIEDREPVIAKFYRPGRWSDAQILEEHRFTQELLEADVSVVAPLADDQGETLHRHANFRFAVFPRRGGHPPELDQPDTLLVLGRTLGRMHAVGAAAPFRDRPAMNPPERIQQSAELLLDGFIPNELKEAYRTLSRDLHARVAALWVDTEDSLIRVHGDCHVGNILWRDRVPHFVDLDDCCTAPAVQDLWMCLSGTRMERQRQLLDLLEGYGEFADFRPRELRWIEALRTARIAGYAAWIASRWEDPAFPRAFPWFDSARYWSDHILELREQLAALEEPPLSLPMP